MAPSPFALRVLAGGSSRELDPAEPNPGFSEHREVEFVVAAKRDAGLRLLVDDAELDEVESSDGETRWLWKPGFYAGEVRAELLDPDGAPLGRFRLDVSPAPGKLGREIFEEILNDIVEFDPALVLGSEPARRRLGALGEADDPLVLFERLRRRREALDQALAAIRREPATVLRPRRRFVPLREARRVDLRTLRSALRSRTALAALRRRGDEEAVAFDAEPVFDTPAVERRLDAPANRAALAMLRALRRRAAALLLRLEKLAEKRSSSTETDLRPRLRRWKEILEGMERRFRAAERSVPFSETTRAEITAAGLNAVAGHPRYARFWQVAWAALRRGVRAEDPEDLLPLAPSWELYERWCFVALANRLGFSPRGAAGDDRRSLVRTGGDGAKLTLQLQATFPSTRGRPRQNGAWSVAAERRPDIVLRRDDGATRPRFLLFDAKYKSAGLPDSVAHTANAYQDGLRWGDPGARPSATLILAPNADEVRHPGWLTDPEFIAEHRVGVVELRPGVEPPDWISDLSGIDRP